MPRALTAKATHPLDMEAAFNVLGRNWFKVADICYRYFRHTVGALPTGLAVTSSTAGKDAADLRCIPQNGGRCCARAMSGHAAAAPPSSVMKWRRLRSSMGSPPEPAVPAYRRLSMPPAPTVLGADLNPSESSEKGRPLWT